VKQIMNTIDGAVNRLVDSEWNSISKEQYFLDEDWE
jgi:hypothetical protein